MILRAYMYGDPSNSLDRKRAEEKAHKAYLIREKKRKQLEKAQKAADYAIQKMKGYSW